MPNLQISTIEIRDEYWKRYRLLGWDSQGMVHFHKCCIEFKWGSIQFPRGIDQPENPCVNYSEQCREVFLLQRHCINDQNLILT
jgi:hypothetical protein